MFNKRIRLRICAAVMCCSFMIVQATFGVDAEETQEVVLVEDAIASEEVQVVIEDNDYVELNSASGDEFIYGDYKFRQVDVNELCVVEYLGSGGDITIPTDANGSVTNHYGTVKYIDENFLYNKDISDKITSVTITKYVVEIGNNAFRDCKNLTSVSFAKTAIKNTMGDQSYVQYKTDLRSIGEHAFSGDVKLVSIDISPQGVELIDDYAFSGCTSLKTIKLPKTLGYIGYNAFLNCIGLSEVYYESEVKNWASITYGTDAKGNESAGSHPNYYANSTYFLRIEIGEWGKVLRAEYYSPLSFSLNNEIDGIGCYVFYNFKNLTNITVCGPSMIGSYAFGNCTSLSDIEIHNTATTIGNSVFAGCTNLYYMRVHQNTVIETKFTEQRGKDGANWYNIVYMSEDGCGDGTESGGEGPSTGGEDSGGDSGENPGEDSEDELDPSVSQIDKLYTLAGYSLTYDGTIGLRYFFTIDSSVTNLSSVTAKFKIPNGNNGNTDTEVTFDKFERISYYYIYTISIAPKDVDSIISVQVVDASGNKGTENKISCYNYLILVESKYDSRSDQNYASQMILRYCDACQHYFDYHEGAISENYMLPSSYYESMECDSKYMATMTDSRFAGFTLLLDSDVSFRLYYKGRVTLANWDSISTIDYLDGYTTYTISGLQFGGSYKGDGYTNANSFNRKIAYYDESLTLNTMWCVYSYLYLALQSGDDDLVYLAKVMLCVDNSYPYVTSKLQSGTGAYVQK